MKGQNKTQSQCDNAPENFNHFGQQMLLPQNESFVKLTWN